MTVGLLARNVCHLRQNKQEGTACDLFKYTCKNSRHSACAQFYPLGSAQFLSLASGFCLLEIVKRKESPALDNKKER